MAQARRYGDRWEVIRPVAEGGQSHVFTVRDVRDEYPGQLVLKRLRNLRRLGRFEREINTVRQLDHPGIAPILDYSLREPAFFVTKFYAGGVLTHHAPLPPLRALDLFIQLCDIVAYAHGRGVIHRDLKPDNIVLDESGTPVVIDFGLCYLEGDDRRLTATMEQVGSRFYIAPELEGGRTESVTDKVDSYALGKTLYFLLSGKDIPREAFREENDLAKLCNDEQLGYVSDRLLAHSVVEDPAKRKSVTELGEEVRKVRRLIEEHYYPGIEGTSCRFCGEGHYGRLIDSTIRVHEPGIEHSVTFKALVCDKCRNVQWFRPPGR